MGIDSVSSSTSSATIKANESLNAANKTAQSGDVQNTKTPATNGTPANFMSDFKGSEVNLKNAAKEVLRTVANNIEKNEAALRDLPPELRKVVEQILKNTVQQNDLSEGVVKFLQNVKSGAEQIMKLANNLEQLVKQFAAGGQNAELKDNVMKVLQNFQLATNVNGQQVQVNNGNDLQALLQQLGSEGDSALPAEIKKVIDTLQSQQKNTMDGQTGNVAKQELPVMQKTVQDILQKMPDLPANVQAKFQQLLTQGDFSGIISTLQSLMKEQEKVNGGEKKDKVIKHVLEQLQEQSESLLKNISPAERELLNKLAEKLSDKGGVLTAETSQGQDEDTIKLLTNLFNLKEELGKNASTNTTASTIKGQGELDKNTQDALAKILKSFQLVVDVDGQKVQIKSESDLVSLIQKFNFSNDKTLTTEIKKLIDMVQSQQNASAMPGNNNKNVQVQQDVQVQQKEIVVGAKDIVPKQEIIVVQKTLQDILQKMSNLPMDVQLNIKQIIGQSDMNGILTSLNLLLKDVEKFGEKGNKSLKQMLDSLQEQSEVLLKNVSPEEKELLSIVAEKMYDGSSKIKVEIAQNKDDSTAKLLKNLAGLFAAKDVMESAVALKGQVDDAKKALKEIAFSMQKGIAVETENTQLNKVFTVSVPLCFADGEKPYPAYIQVFKDKSKEQASDPDKKRHGVWMRVVLETQNIGVIENSFHLYGDKQLSVKIRANDFEVVKMFNENKGEVKEALDDMEFSLEDFMVNAAK